MPGRPRPNRSPLTEGVLIKGNYYDLTSGMLGSIVAANLLGANTSDLLALSPALFCSSPERRHGRRPTSAMEHRIGYWVLFLHIPSSNHFLLASIGKTGN